MMEIRPIKTQRDYRAALKTVESLWDAPKRSLGADHLDVWVTLIEAYEAKHLSIEPPGAVDAILFRMEQGGHSRADFAALLGVGSGRVSEIINGKRNLTVEMIRTLHAAWGIPLESLVNARQRKPTQSVALGSKRKTPGRTASR